MGVQFRVKNRQSPGGWCWLAEGGGWGGGLTPQHCLLEVSGVVARDFWTMSARVEQLSWAVAKKAPLPWGGGGLGANIPVEGMFTYKSSSQLDRELSPNKWVIAIIYLHSSETLFDLWWRMFYSAASEILKQSLFTCCFTHFWVAHLRIKVSLTSTLEVNFRIRENKQKPHFEWEIFLFGAKKNFPNRSGRFQKDRGSSRVPSCLLMPKRDTVNNQDKRKYKKNVKMKLWTSCKSHTKQKHSSI